MMKKALVIAGMVLMCFLPLHAADTPALDIPAIRQFYEDLNFIANNSTNRERIMISLFRRGLRGDGSALTDPRLKSVAEKMDSMRSRGFSMDPGIYRGKALETPAGYSFAAELVQVLSRSEDRISLKVLRTAPRDVNPEIKEKMKSGRQWDGLRGSSFIQFDEWYLIDGEWRISDLHAFLMDA